MARRIIESKTADGTTYRVRYRKAGVETSRTFRRKSDAEMFRDILGNGKTDRIHEAESWLAAKEDQQRTATFGEYFDRWVGDLTGITPRTRDDYRAQRRRYLTELDQLPLPLVTRTHVAAIVNRLEAEGKSPKTIKNAINMLSTVMQTAVEDGLVTRNPARRVRLPKPRHNEDAVLFLTHDEAARVIAATPEHYRPLVTFLFGTGLRWSEATALQRRHVDIENGTVRIERAWKRIPGGFEIGPPKSTKSRRTVNAAVPALLAVASLMDRRPTDLLFTTKLGNPVRHGNFFNRVWKPALTKAGWPETPRPGIHACRRTFGSWLISEGISLEAVQDQLGHESYETTRKIYAHLLPAVGVEAGRAASAALHRALAAADGVNFGVRALEAGRDPQ